MVNRNATPPYPNVDSSICRDRALVGVGCWFCQEYMSDSLGVPATQHAFEDVALQFQAMKLKLNPEVTC